MPSPAARKAQFRRMERLIAFARRGKKRHLIAKIQAERLSDLRAIADRTREGWTLEEPAQADMFSARSP